MGYKWKHVCSLKWMRARQKYLTASDVKALLPVTTTGRPRKVTDRERLKVWASKLPKLTVDDCVSTGAAARGHILEPFAIDKWNKDAACTLCYWDDVVIYGDVPGLSVQPAFSPDALSVSMPKGVVELPESKLLPKLTLGEVKCYSHERHILTAYTAPEELEERWQIAHAMYTSSAITEGWLILFDPSMGATQMFSTRYARADLADEISKIGDVVEEYDDFVKRNKLTEMTVHPGRREREEEIMAIFRDMKRMNP